MDRVINIFVIFFLCRLISFRLKFSPTFLLLLCKLNSHVVSGFREKRVSRMSKKIAVGSLSGVVKVSN